MYTNASFNLETRRMTQERLPYEQQYSARSFSLDTVFGCATLDGNNVGQTSWYYRIDTWEKYLDFLTTTKSKGKIFKRPKHFRYHEWNPIGVDNDDL